MGGKTLWNIGFAYRVGAELRLGPIGRSNKIPASLLAGAAAGGLSCGRLGFLEGRGAVFAILELILIDCAAYLTFHKKPSCADSLRPV